METISTIRPILIQHHPLINKEYTIPTPAIDSLVSLVTRCIGQRIPGAIVIGKNRFGKSTGIKYTINYLSVEQPNVAVFRFLCTRELRDNADIFFAHLLHSFGHADPFSGKAYQKRARLIERLRHKAGPGRRGLIIIFADEAQQLTPTMYDWLSDIYNELDFRHVTVITFMVGQPDLYGQKLALIQADKMAVVGRFMLQQLRFQGVASADDVATCLNAYDNSYFPENTNWSYTRFFFPRAYLVGLRMVQFAQSLWDVFQECHECAGAPGELEIPMQYFSSAVEYAFRTYTENDSANFSISREMWGEAVENTSFKSLEETLHLRMTMSVPEP